MTRARGTLLLVWLAVWCLLAAPASAVPVQDIGVMTTTDLVALQPSVSGARVTIVGEAIGDALRAGPDHVFVNLLQDSTAIGVWMPREESDRIGGFGDYHTTGAELRVTGIVNVACPQHGGDFDIHAEEISIVRGARARPTEPVRWRFGAAFGALVLAAGQLMVYRWYRRKRFEL